MSWFFPISKLVWLLLAPSRLLLWMALATGVLALAGRTRTARGLAVATALSFLAIGALPTGAWLARPLENQYPRPALPARVDGVITLGGGLETRRLLSRQAPATAPSVMRLISTFELARRYPHARILFTGGWGAFADATAAKYLFAQLGLDPSRLWLESRSRNTYENLLFSQRLAQPKPGETWVLATSAIQLPRAMAVAQRLGWRLIPWPTDYLTDRSDSGFVSWEGPDVAGGLTLTDAAAHEWVGLLAYRLSDLSKPAASAARTAKPA